MSELYCLVEQEIPRLRRYARALTRDRGRADDLVQDTLLRALAKQHLWQPGTDIRAWLFTIMHHQYVNTVRREAREAATVDIEHHRPWWLRRILRRDGSWLSSITRLSDFLPSSVRCSCS